MSCKYSLLFLFLCGFAALSVSTTTCGKKTEDGTSCTIEMPTKNIDKSNEIKWLHVSSGDLFHWKNERIKKNTLGAEMEKDGSLIFKSVSLKNSGKYKYTVFNAEGSQIASGENEIEVYAKAPIPTVMISCKNGNATLTCDTGDRTDLTVSWYKEGKIIQNEKTPELFLTLIQVQENKPYSCSVRNPVSDKKSNSVTVSCQKDKGLSLDKLFGFDFWIMVSILAGGGALLLLLICVLVICACRRCNQRKKEQDEDELRLRVFPDEGYTGTARSKHTARGQPAPPVPQEDPSPQTPTQTETQPKAQTRGRPPPPPEDDEEYPPPLPRPRNKQQRKRHEEPYRPME